MSITDKRIEWKARFEAWETSGLSAAEWCREQGIKKSQMYYWIRKFRNEEVTKHNSNTKWLALDLYDTPSGHTDQESVLVHLSTMSIEVRPGTNMELLSNVMRVIQK